MSLDNLHSLLAAVIALLIGAAVNRRIGFLSKFNIPEPITGGLLFAIIASAVWAATDFTIVIDSTIKPLLLLMFFAGVGLCADLSLLKKGGKALAIFLIVLAPFVIVQNVVGVSVAKALDLHPIFGVVAGSITLVGGHGTGAAYAERFAEVNNLLSVMEITMTVATIGLIVGGIVGGPVAQYLINRHNLRMQTSATTRSEQHTAAAAPINTIHTIGTLAGIFLAVAVGRWLGERFTGGAVTIPSFLWCMMAGVAIRNVTPLVGLRMNDRASELVSSVCLSLFLVMTMMALNLVEVAVAAGPFMVIIAAQTAAIIVYAILVCYRIMGRDYEAAVTCAAFIGFNMGSTATAMANMQAVVNKYGPAPTSFLIVPLAGAFFIDLINAIVLTLVLAMPFIGG